MERSGPALALLLLGCYRKLVDEAVVGLAERGFKDVRPVHDFALRAIAAGADSASELGRSLSVSKQAAAKTIATLLERGYVVGNGSKSPHSGSKSCAPARRSSTICVRAGEFNSAKPRWRHSRPN
jgi:MarR family